MFSITSFTDDSDKVGFLSCLSDFFLKLYPYPMVSILTDIFLPDWIGWVTWKWKDFPLETYCSCFVIVKFIQVVFSFVSFLCWNFGLEFVAVVVCTIMQKVGSSTLVAWACLLHGFNFCDRQCIQGVESTCPIALSSFIPNTDIMNIPWITFPSSSTVHFGVPQFCLLAS